MYKPLPTHTEEDVFKLSDLYMIAKSLRQKQCVDICTDDAWLLVGETHYFIAYVKAIAPAH
jgi:hypothetical protein